MAGPLGKPAIRGERWAEGLFEDPQTRIISVRTVQFGPAEPFSRAYAVLDRGDKSRSANQGYSVLPPAPFRGRKHCKAMTHNGKDPRLVLPKAPQPPLSHPWRHS
jgi:hypothetical protein